MSDNNMEESNNRPPCAACKYQRKKCMPECILRKHFPANLAEDFKAVHNVFGISNVKKSLEKVGVPQQDEVAKSIIWEAKMWDQDPVHGPYGCCMKLKQELEELKQEQRNNQCRQSQIMNRPRQPQDINSYLHWNVGSQQLGGHSSILPEISTTNQGIPIQSRFLQQQHREGTGPIPLSHPSLRTGQWSGIHTRENIESSNVFASPLIRDGSDGSQTVNQDTENLQAIGQQRFVNPMQHNNLK